MALYLGILLFSFLVTAIAIVPFIDFLYRCRFLDPVSLDHPGKLGTPRGAGILLISLTTLLYFFLFPLLTRLGIYVITAYPYKEELNIIFFTFISFGLLGLYTDLLKVYRTSIAIHSRKFLKLGLSAVVGLLLYQNLHIHILNIPGLGVWDLGLWYFPLATLTIFFFTTGFNSTDRMDGLGSGILLICLLTLWGISVSSLDTVLSIFLGLWIGSVIAFLYFNVYPARIQLGNVGSMSFGSTLAVTGLLLGKGVALVIIGALVLLYGLGRPPPSRLVGVQRLAGT